MIPAVASALTSIPAVGRLFREPSHKRAAKIAPQLFNLALTGETAARIELERLSKQAATSKAKAIYADYFSRLPPVSVTGSRTTTGLNLTAAQQRMAVTAGAELVRAATRSVRSGSGRKVTRYNPDTGRKARVYANSEAGMNWPATKAEYNAMVGGGASGSRGVSAQDAATGVRAARAATRGAGATLAKAGVIIGGLAAGYYIGTQLNKYLAGRALGKEQAGVQAALAFRNARRDAAEQKGSPLTAAETRSMGEVYKRQLLALGYDPVTFTRRRSTVERFFTGEEE